DKQYHLFRGVVKASRAIERFYNPLHEITIPIFFPGRFTATGFGGLKCWTAAWHAALRGWFCYEGIGYNVIGRTPGWIRDIFFGSGSTRSSAQGNNQPPGDDGDSRLGH